MEFLKIAGPQGLLGAQIGDSVAWQPAPTVALKRSEGEVWLKWSWTAPPSSPAEAGSYEFFTLPTPHGRAAKKRANRKDTDDPNGVEGFIARSDAVGFDVQTVQARSSGGKGLLDDFTRLEGAADRDILAFARRWGPLYLCQHGRPFQHNGPWRPGYDPKNPCTPLGLSGVQVEGKERLAEWRRYSREAKRILKLVEIAWERPAAERIKSPAFIRAIFAVNEWLSEGGAIVAIGFDPSDDGEISIGVHESAGVFGLLGLQLMSTLNRSTSPASCSSCGAGFIPAHQPPRGIRRYCARCRRSGAPLRDASRDYYRRKNQAVAP